MEANRFLNKICCKDSRVKEQYDLCDIWRIINPFKISFTFQQNHPSGIINRRLDYIFIKNKLYVFPNKVTIILPAFKTNYSTVLVIISNYNEVKPSPGLWKFNNSVISDETFSDEKLLMKTVMKTWKILPLKILLMTK